MTDQHQGSIPSTREGPKVAGLALQIRKSITAAIKKSPKTRVDIAREMSELLGRDISLKSFNAMTSPSRPGFRFPLEWLPAFCLSVGNNEVLRFVARLLNEEAVSHSDAKILRAYKRHRRSEKLLRNALGEVAE